MVMMVTEQEWYKYRTTDKNGFINGVKKNAPKRAKDAYAEYEKLQLKYDL